MIPRGNGRLASRACSSCLPRNLGSPGSYFAYPVEESIGWGSSMKIAKFTEEASVEESGGDDLMCCFIYSFKIF
jgi:hypothetical protein